MAISRTRENRIVLYGNDIPTLKTELQDYLSEAMNKQPVNKTLVSYKIPMGIGEIIEAGRSVTKIIPFPVAGVIENLMSFLPPSTKDVFVKITVSNKGIEQGATQRLQDDYRAYTLKLLIPAVSVVRVEISNNCKVAVEAIVGFTFEERLSDEIRTTELIGNL
jgi:hypothetical protein